MYADRLVDRFTDTGLMLRDHDRVKLHVTVMNSLMRKDPSGTTVKPQATSRGAGGGRERESFDATNVLKVTLDNRRILIQIWNVFKINN